MVKIAVYGKGGIGKSTTVSNISAALADMGYKVMQIGCDPKADSTASLHSNKAAAENAASLNLKNAAAPAAAEDNILSKYGRGGMPTVLELVRERKNDFTLEDMVRVGYGGVICVEAGGPAPGLGCAGRGIIAALEKLKEKGAYSTYNPDVVIYDVLGDVVCGGFSMPMRGGYADKVFVITSGENMAIHAAANIAVAIDGFRDRGYATLGGIILNRRNVRDEDAKVAELASDIGSEIIGELTRSDTVTDAEDLGKTVIEAFPDSEMAEEYRTLAKKFIEICGIEHGHN